MVKITKKTHQTLSDLAAWFLGQSARSKHTHPNAHLLLFIFLRKGENSSFQVWPWPCWLTYSCASGCKLRVRPRRWNWAPFSHRCKWLHGGEARGEESAPGTPLPLPAVAAARCGTFKASAAFWKPKPEAVNVFVCKWSWEVMKVSASVEVCKGPGWEPLKQDTAQKFFLPQRHCWTLALVMTKVNCVSFHTKEFNRVYK